MQLGKRKKKKTILRHTILFTYSSRGWGRKQVNGYLGMRLEAEREGLQRSSE